MDHRFEDIREPLLGFRDIYGREARVKNYLSNRISEVFQKWGYSQIVIPIVERASSFSEDVVGGSPWPEWDKRGVFYLQLSDYANAYSELPVQSPAVLIPEGTISVSRWLGKMLHKEGDGNHFPRKIFYSTPCFRNELTSKLSDTKGRQFNQVGIELLGSANIMAEIEVLQLIYNGFLAIDVPGNNMLIRLGSVRLFNALCDESNLSDQARIVLKDKLDTIAEARAGKGSERLEPETRAILALVDQLELPAATKTKWQALCSTQGQQLSAQACELFDFPELTAEMNTVAKVCQDMGMNCVVDTAVVRSHEYYTGIVFEIDLRIKGQLMVEVAGGGRFNKLISNFLDNGKMEIPAVGFAYGLERIYEAFLLVQDGAAGERSVSFWPDEADVDVVVYSASAAASAMRAVFNAADTYRRAGKRVDVYVGESTALEDVKGYARKVGAQLVVSDAAVQTPVTE
jgi:histidyl-tRNA synthetase